MTVHHTGCRAVLIPPCTKWPSQYRYYLPGPPHYLTHQYHTTTPEQPSKCPGRVRWPPWTFPQTKGVPHGLPRQACWAYQYSSPASWLFFSILTQRLYAFDWGYGTRVPKPHTAVQATRFCSFLGQGQLWSVRSPPRDAPWHVIHPASLAELQSSQVPERSPPTWHRPSWLAAYTGNKKLGCSPHPDWRASPRNTGHSRYDCGDRRREDYNQWSCRGVSRAGTGNQWVL